MNGDIEHLPRILDKVQVYQCPECRDYFNHLNFKCESDELWFCSKECAAAHSMSTTHTVSAYLYLSI